MAYLKIHLPSGIREVELAGYNTIGRDLKNRITIPDTSVSKNHAVILINRYKQILIRDCSSTNGTLVNSIRIDKDLILFDGDEVKIGNIRCVLKGETGIATQMVKIHEEKNLTRTTMILPVKDRFLPEKEILSEEDLRADYEKLRVTHELLRDMTLDSDVAQIPKKILDRIFDFLTYDHGVILLLNREGEMMPYSYKTEKGEKKLTISSTIVNSVKRKKAGIISSDILTDNRFNEAESIISQGIKSTIAAPFLDKEDLLGIIILSSVEAINTFTEKDLVLIMSIAGQAAQILKNSLLHQELRLSFESSIRTLSAMVDERHPKTAGHSERVTEHAIFIAKEMNLSDHEIESLKFAALLHDIGKIGIQDNVLLKDGKFTEKERHTMNKHPVKTREILNNFRFPVYLKGVPEVAAYHHEKINGKGYPDGLEGDQIPLISKIIAVADVFDALTVKRDYPKYTSGANVSYDPLPLPEVISIIKDDAGSHFDQKVVDAFISCLPKMLSHFKGIHFKSEYVTNMLESLTSG